MVITVANHSINQSHSFRGKSLGMAYGFGFPSVILLLGVQFQGLIAIANQWHSAHTILAGGHNFLRKTTVEPREKWGFASYAQQNTGSEPIKHGNM